MLTPAATYQLGFLIHPHPISTQRLTVEFSFEIEGGSGADGLALVVARNLLDDPILESGGSGGCGGCFASPQFVDGIAVEFDTYRNSWDISRNHFELSLLGESAPVDLAAVNIDHALRNNGVFNAEVMFDNARVGVYLSNSDQGMERTLLLDYTIPDFAPFQGYLGFVGTTGAATDRHVIHQVSMEGVDPIARQPATPTDAEIGDRRALTALYDAAGGEPDPNLDRGGMLGLYYEVYPHSPPSYGYNPDGSRFPILADLGVENQLTPGIS